ncbi:MAG: caspase family protein [Spirochaetota bacterium]
MRRSTMDKTSLCVASSARPVIVAFLVLAIASGLWCQARGLSVIAQQVTDNSNFDIGKQYAVIIGIDSYESWNPLKGAVAEAKNLKQVLADNYYIDEFVELYDRDATAANIRKLFSQTLPAKLGLHDSLLIFYAGHGHLDESKSGFWIPVDGGTDTLTQDRWLANAQLRNYVGLLKAQRILIMADSCFSGDLLNTSRAATPKIDSAYYKQALQLTARQVLSAGSSETVPDNSEFAKALIGYLERNTEPMIDSLSIYERIRKGMTETLPLFGSLSGNENGASFVLFRKQGGSDAAIAQATPQAPLSQVAAAKSTATIHINSASNGYDLAVSAVPEDNPNATPVLLAEGSQLPVGKWIIKARISDDVESTWTSRLSLPDTKDALLAIPSLDYSLAYQFNALYSQRSLIMQTLQKEEAKYKAQKGWGWVSLAAGLAGAALAGYGWMDGTTVYPQYGAAIGDAVAPLRAKLDLDSTLLLSGAGLGAVGISLSSFMFLVDPASTDREKVKRLDLQITELKAKSATAAP